MKIHDVKITIKYSNFMKMKVNSKMKIILEINNSNSSAETVAKMIKKNLNYNELMKIKKYICTKKRGMLC